MRRLRELPAADGAATRGNTLGADDVSGEPIKIQAKVVSHAQAVTFQLAEAAVLRSLFAAVLERIDQLQAIPGMG